MVPGLMPRPLPLLPERPFVEPPGEVVQSEPMTRFACNQKGCCCQGWQIRFTLDDFLRLHAWLPEPDKSQLAQGIELLVDTRDGVSPAPGEAKEAVLHALRLGTVGEDDRCRFLEGEGGCRVHAAQGLHALPDICVDFPAGGYRDPDNGTVDLWWDPICPEVLRQLDESDAPLTLHRGPPRPVPPHDAGNPPRSPEDSAAFRVRNATQLARPRIGELDVTRAELEQIREEALRALHHPTRPAWRSLYAVAEGFRTLLPQRPLSFVCEEGADPMPFLRHLNSCIGANGPNTIASTLLRYRRFIHALDAGPALADPQRLARALEAWPASFERRLATQEDALRPLLLSYLSHRFAMPWVNQDGELRTSADTIVFTFATALRIASALADLLGRDVDRAVLQVGIGCSEYFWRTVEVPADVLPWYCAAAAPGA